MLKRVSSVVLTVVMLLSMLCTISVASAETALPQLELTVNDTDGKVEAGQWITVDVGLKNSVPVSGIVVHVPYSEQVYAGWEAIIPDYYDAYLNNGFLIIALINTENVADPTDLFQIKLRYSSDLEVDDKVALNAAIEELYSTGNPGENNQYLADEYVAVSDTLEFEVYSHTWGSTWYTENDLGSAQHYRLCVNDICNGEDATDYADCNGWTWNNNDTQTGSKHLCADCGRPVDCDWDTGLKTPATCTADAYTTYKCLIEGCNGTYKVVDVGTAAGHTLEKDASGTTHSCSKCSDIKNVACSFTKLVQEGNCVTDTIKECVCGNRQTTAASGTHTELVINYLAPTGTADGYIKVHCNACKTDVTADSYNKNNTVLTKGQQFTDLPLSAATTNWFYDEAVFAKSFGLMGGDGEGNFSGNAEITRGQVVTVLGRYLWGYLEQMSEADYNALLESLPGDVVELKDLKGSYYDRYAVALSAIGVVTGSEGNFLGDNLVPREQLAAFFVRFVNYVEPNSDKTYAETSALSDMNTVSAWAVPEATRAVETGLITGMDGKFNPRGNASRAQMATIMERVVRAHSVYPIEDVK